MPKIKVKVANQTKFIPPVRMRLANEIPISTRLVCTINMAALLFSRSTNAPIGIANSSQGKRNRFAWIAIRIGSLVRDAARRGMAAPMRPSANLLNIAADQILLKVTPRVIFSSLLCTYIA
jgi:hypothetical protein